MGIALGNLVEGTPILLHQLSGKTIAIDAFNFLYQFLATIRGPDGSPLTNARGDITSHLIGTLSRTLKLMEHNIKVIYIFDGESPELKKQERERRRKLKEEAQKEYDIAKERQDFEAMKKFASRTSRLNKDMVQDVKELLDALGIPWVQAPSEGEAQAAYMAKKEDVYAIASQDFDSLLFGAPRIIRNLSISGKRKVAGKQTYLTLQPTLLELDQVINQLGVDHKQLISLGILIGTDFNVGGIKGIGPQKGLALVKKHPHDISTIFAEAHWDEHFDFAYQKIFDIFENIPVEKNYSTQNKAPDIQKLTQILIKKHGFSQQRVQAMTSQLVAQHKASQQKGLGDFF